MFLGFFYYYFSKFMETYAIACTLKFYLILYIIPLNIGKSPKIIFIKAFTKLKIVV
ncbi:hypothetical protein HMPREF9422_1944 [Streptococcus cristatus ATCC 51100]|nr:hypothetical protein HMPREF9422_1944 [Streptococcus cristatus ATCC 51100]